MEPNSPTEPDSEPEQESHPEPEPEEEIRPAPKEPGPGSETRKGLTQTVLPQGATDASGRHLQDNNNVHFTHENNSVKFQDNYIAETIKCVWSTISVTISD